MTGAAGAAWGAAAGVGAAQASLGSATRGDARATARQVESQGRIDERPRMTRTATIHPETRGEQRISAQARYGLGKRTSEVSSALGRTVTWRLVSISSTTTVR